MILITAFNGYMAWVQDAELLALYAIVGGLSTPLLISTGENHEVALFSYLLLLDLAVLVLVALKPWSRLLFAAFMGTVLLFIGWGSEFYTDAQFARTSFFLACFFLIFAFAPRLVRVKEDDTAGIHGWDALALACFPRPMPRSASSAFTECSTGPIRNGPAPGWRLRLQPSICFCCGCRRGEGSTRPGLARFAPPGRRGGLPHPRHSIEGA